MNIGSTRQSHEELASELTHLNQTLKLELQQCHHYIQTLERDLKQSQYKLSLQTNTSFTLETLQREINDLKEQNEKLHQKLKDKRNQVKKLERSIGGLEGALEGAIQEKEKLVENIQTMERRSSLSLSHFPNQLRTMEVPMIQTKQSFQLLSKQIQAKENTTEKLRIQQLEKEKEIKSKELESLRSNNSLLNSQLQQKIKENQDLIHSHNALNSRLFEVSRQNQQIQKNSSLHIKDLQFKYQQTINELNRVGKELQVSKRTKTDLDASFNSRVSILSSPRDPKFNPVTRRITIDQHTMRQREQSEKKQLVQSVNTLQQQIKYFQDEQVKENTQIVKLKNDLVNMKIEYSNVLSKNNQLIEANVKLERQKNEMFVKLEGLNTNRTNIMTTDRSMEASNRIVLNKSVNSRMSTTNGSIINKHVPDGEVPVRDRNSVRASNVGIPYCNQGFGNLSIQNRKSPVIGRPNLMTFSSLK